MTALMVRAACGLVAALIAFSACASTQSELVFRAPNSTIDIPATLIRPDGDGPFPAVVILHDCSGLGPKSSGAPMRWAGELVPQGYVVLIPDSFTPRGFQDGTCFVPGSESVRASGYVRAGDAYGALTVLRALPYVDGRHVGVMGGSHGGWSTLATMSAPLSDKEPLASAKRDGYTAAIALYPGCAMHYGTWTTQREDGKANGRVVSHSGVFQPTAPVLILVGDKDDWTPAEPCRWLVESSRAAGFPVDLKVYPGAYHSFDSASRYRFDPNRVNGNSSSGRGATTGGNPEAWADARKQVAAFFALHLKEQK
jgi:dienelactone hydrolase